ncbi:hypothetical protein AQJ66_24110 [Streptomyces bungoensis]|uniref:Uncharacterized protein n=1 Tax=Streptomyces bungoensis TaxID=285568 RepID=A0A101SWL8_9ACTN|nr:hypothetical protein [Streptomyces bungoensis]KUN81487.1 hypothetical protein AQJ66_24110 [Streptomyces bungoensis]
MTACLYADQRAREKSGFGSAQRELGGVQADFVGLLDDRPGRLLALVLLGDHRAYVLLGREGAFVVVTGNLLMGVAVWLVSGR